MKKTFFGLIILMLTFAGYAQQDPVQALFDKYTGADGFITVTLTGDMLKMAAQVQEYKYDTTFNSQLDQVRILVEEKSEQQPAVNFYNEVYGNISKSVYKELISIQEDNTKVSLMAKESNGDISEFLVIVGGDKENVLVQAKGNILLHELAEMSENFNLKGFDQLKYINQ